MSKVGFGGSGEPHAVLRWRLQEVLGQSWEGRGPVPSPCLALCRVDAARQSCASCWRTLDEITAWRALSDPQRLAVWRQLEQRWQTQELRPGS